jgi:hypothetical protein
MKEFKFDFWNKFLVILYLLCSQAINYHNSISLETRQIAPGIILKKMTNVVEKGIFGWVFLNIDSCETV